MTLRLQQVGVEDMPSMYALLVLCGEHMHRVMGLSHWYPFRPYEMYVEQVDINRLYALYSDENLVGTFTLNEQPRAYYRPDLWAQPDARAVYFGLFGVLPMLQGQGIGRWAMQQADSLAQSNGYTVLRFDAVGEHTTLLRFYDRLGYVQRCTLTFPNRSFSTVCYEKVFGAT